MLCAVAIRAGKEARLFIHGGEREMGSVTSREEEYANRNCEICCSFTMCMCIHRMQVKQPKTKGLDGRKENVPVTIWLCSDCYRRDIEIEQGR